MTTIYEHLINEDYSVEPLIISRLIVLLKIVTGIDLTGQDCLFKRNTIITGGFVTIEFYFSYGSASVTSKKGVLTADFKFLKKMKEQLMIDKEARLSKILPICPFNVSQCQIDVDHEMNFEKARFEHYINISKYNLNRNESSSAYCAIKITHVLDKGLNRFNTVEYNNLHSTTFRTYADMSAIGLNSYFLTPNNDFEQFLIKFLDFFKQDPRMFYTIFTEYPSFVHVIEQIDKAKDFLNLLHKQYINDFELLQSKMLLIDMLEI